MDNLLQLLPVVVQLATLVFQGLSLLLDLDDGGFDHVYFVTEEFLRLHFLLSKLSLQRCHPALVTHLVLDHGSPHGVKREVRPPRTIKPGHTCTQLCLRTTPHYFGTLI